MCDTCKARLRGGLAERLSRLKINDFGREGLTGSCSSNSDFLHPNSGSDGYGASGASSSSSHCGAGCTCSACSEHSGSNEKLAADEDDLSYRVFRDFDCGLGCTCEETPDNPDRKRVEILLPEGDDSGRYSSEENLSTERMESPRRYQNVRDTQHPLARYRLVRRNSDSSIFDYINKPELPACKESSLSASSDSFKNICCRIHEDLKEAFVKGGKLELADGGYKGTWKAAIEAVVKAFFKRKAQREAGKSQGKQKKEKKTKKEKQVKTIWRRPTPYIYVTDSYGFKVRRPLHPPEYLDKQNYLYLVSYVDRSYLSQLTRTDF